MLKGLVFRRSGKTCTLKFQPATNRWISGNIVEFLASWEPHGGSHEPRQFGPEIGGSEVFHRLASPNTNVVNR